MSKTELWVNRTKRRYYRIHIYRDLLGDWVLMRMWGSLDSQKGGDKIEILSCFEDGISKLKEIHKRRVAHDYDLVN